MSVDFGKLNKPGLRASFGAQKSRTSVAAQATKNLSNASAASKSSIFSLSGRHSSNWVAGTRTNVDVTRHNYQNVRASLNSGGFVSARADDFGLYNNYSGFTNVNYNPNQSMMTGQVIGQVLNGTFGLLNSLGVLNTSNNQSSANQQLDTELNSNNTVGNVDVSSLSSDVSSVVTDMNSAQTSSALRTSISNAKSKYGAVQTATRDLEKQQKQATKDVQEYSKQVTSLERSISTQQSDVNRLTSSVENLETKMKSLDADYNNKCQALTQAESNLQQANTELSSAQSELTAAEALPADTPGKEAKVQAARTKLDQAKIAQQQAQEAKNNAETAKEAACNAAKDAKEDFKRASDQLDQTKQKLQETQDSLTKNKEDLKVAQEKCNTAKDIIEEFTQSVQDSNGLQTAITNAEKRLEKLEKNELKEYDNLTTEIQGLETSNSKLLAKIDGSDGYDKKEAGRARQINENNAKIDESRARQMVLRDDVIDTKLKQQPSETVNSSQYKKLDFEGETFYSKDGIRISADELPDELKTKWDVK